MPTRRQRCTDDLVAGRWSLVASLAAGNSALSDLDALRTDETDRTLLGIDEVPLGRRLGEYLARFGTRELDDLLGVIRSLVRHVAPSVTEAARGARPYMPVSVDGTAIEVDGDLFQGAAPGYDGRMQYWPQQASTNTLERLNKEIKRRSRVVGIFPSDASIERFVGAMLAEQTDEWRVGRRYTSLEAVSAVLRRDEPGAVIEHKAA